MSSSRFSQTSYGIALLTVAGILSALLYSLYLVTRPCVDGYRCEAPPIFFFFLFIAIIASPLNLIGFICGWFAQDSLYPIQKQRPYVIWNAIILGLCLSYIGFIIFAMMMGY